MNSFNPKTMLRPGRRRGAGELRGNRRSNTYRKVAIVLACIASMTSPSAAGAADAKLSLVDAVRQALEANLDLAAQRNALAADREQRQGE